MVIRAEFVASIENGPAPGAKNHLVKHHVLEFFKTSRVALWPEEYSKRSRIGHAVAALRCTQRGIRVWSVVQSSGELSEVPDDTHLAQEKWDSLFELVGKNESHQYRGDVMLILQALKLAADVLEREQMIPDADRYFQLQMAMSAASLLMGLQSTCGVVDAETIAACLVMLEVSNDRLSLGTVNEVLGPIVESLVSASMSVWKTIADVEVFDDSRSKECQEKCLSGDVRAVLACLAYNLDMLHRCSSIAKHKQQEVALEALMIFTPIAYALSLKGIAQEVENLAMKILFPASHKANEEWLVTSARSGQGTLAIIKENLLEAIQKDEKLCQLFSEVELLDRVKSITSFMRKVLSLDKIAMGGRQRDEVFDVLGLRVVVHPNGSDKSAEEDALQACYQILDLLHTLWDPVPGRLKDYIANPKPNGYQSLHTTLKLNHNVTDSSSRQSEMQCESMGQNRPPTMSSQESVVGDGAQPDENSVEDTRSGISPDHFLTMDYQDDLASDKGGIGGPNEIDGSNDCLVEEKSMDEVNGVSVFEVQIRTKRMDDKAESGPSAHLVYKSGIPFSTILASQRQLPSANELAGLLSE